MEVELQEIRDFIADIPPFDRLPADKITSITHQITVRYFRRGKTVLPEPEKLLFYILRKGAIELWSLSGRLVEKLSDGDFCTAFCLSDPKEALQCRVTEDTLVYAVDYPALSEIIKDHHSVSEFLQNDAAGRLGSAVSAHQEEAASGATLMNTTIDNMMSTGVISIDIGETIVEAAKLMTRNRVSSIIVTENDKPAGIITDRDLRQRCLAVGLPSETLVDRIMTKIMFSVQPKMLAFDALMTMARKHIHHLPVIKNDKVLGMITATDLIRYEGRHSVYLTSSIRKAKNLDALIDLSKQLPALQVQLADMGGSAKHVGNAVSSVTSAITRRLIQMAEQAFGPPPVPYAWVAGGSQARREQLSHSDQDNCLIISDEMKPSDEAWFAELADFVCDGLHMCGYVYCPGEAMARNPKWRQTQSVWQDYFDSWINTPEPMALMLSSIFFDLRVICGDVNILDTIRSRLLSQTKNNELFLAHLTANALLHRVPLGFFRSFVLVDDGVHNDALDLKHNGLVPIIDMARIYALSEGVPSVNTMDRIEKTAGTKSLSSGGAANILDAFMFINRLRMHHQARQIKSGREANNFVNPESLSRLEREHLKSAFRVVQSMQSALEQHYKADHIR